MKTNNNQMICDLETGVCGVPGEEENELIDFNQPVKTIDLYYVTDPICSHCWALEPVLRRFVEQYGDHFNFRTVMGGLLEKWSDTPVDPGNGIAKPSDVAGHWREVGEHSRMPIDGTLWYDNHVHSSYPPSRVYKIIQKHHSDKMANEFLRRTRELLFAFNKNIAKREELVEIFNALGLNGEEIVSESESSVGQQLLLEDFALVRKLGVRGFPTIVFVNEENQGVKVVGARSVETYVDALSRVLGDETVQPKRQPSLANLLKKEKLLFSKEIEVMYDVEQADVEAFIEKELQGEQYEISEILGEKYVISKE